MSMKIIAVVIYSTNGDMRTVKFRENGLNIITGSSKTGKSSLIDIIDYCLGRSECYVADGVIRRAVSWFSVHLKNENEELFIARRNPPRDRSTDPDVCVVRGRITEYPIYPSLQANIPVGELEKLVTRFCGIAENEFRPETGSRRPLRANISHALFMCFQKQDEIASRERLFHRQGEPFIPQAIKDTLPYFLGAINQEFFLWQRELDVAQQELKKLEALQASIAASTERALSRARQFIIDAKQANLLEPSFETSDPQVALQRLAIISKESAVSDPLVSEDEGQILTLRQELQTLRSNLVDVQNDIRATRHFLSEQSAFSREASEQRDRLVSLNLYKGSKGPIDVCPLCESELSVPVPGAETLERALHDLSHQLTSVAAESPHLQARLGDLNEKRQSVQDAILQAQKALERAYVADEKSRALRDQAIERARVIGRIGAFVEQTTFSSETEELASQIDEAKKRVAVLAERVNSDDISDRIQSIFNLLSDRMTEYAADLNLEHTGGRIRLDLKKLTVIADTNTGPVQLNRMGSGENWVGYHVATMLALHHWFRATNRPVPGFLFFDQPTQAHYPPEADKEGKLDDLLDADRQAVRNLFQTMLDAARQIGDSFQLIVLDHAHLDDAWFDGAIVEEWRGGKALVPTSWLE